MQIFFFYRALNGTTCGGFYTWRPAGLIDGNIDAVKVCVLVCVCVKWFSSICAVVPKLKKHLAQNLDC